MAMGMMHCASSMPLHTSSCTFLNGSSVSLPSTFATRSLIKSQLQRVPLHALTNTSSSVPGYEDHNDGLFAIDDGMFEEAFAPARNNHEVEEVEGGSSSLIPEEWKPLQEELSKTKREKKREVLDILLERSKKIQVQRRLNIEKREAGSEAYRQRFFPQVLPDEIRNRKSTELEDRKIDVDDEYAEYGDEISYPETGEPVNATSPPSQRAKPRNPRLSLGNTMFEDLAQELKVAEECERQPAEENSRDNDEETREVSGSKLLTAVEKTMLRSTKPNFSRISSEKWIPLHALAASGQINLVTVLLRHDIDINARDMDGLTALHKAALCGRESMIRYLLKAGADIMAADNAGASLLHYAAQSANGNLIKVLIRNKADINAQDNQGWTPLHVAIQSGRSDVVKLLLSRGSDISIQNKDGYTSLDLALSFGRGFGYYHVVKLLKKAQVQASQDLMQFSLLGEDLVPEE